MENNSILQKLDGLEARFEEVSTLITDPDVIADQNRFVKLTKEYKDLGDIMDARKRYIACLNSIKEAKDILANEDDPEMKEMAREELAANEELQPRKSRLPLFPKIQKTPRTCRWRSVQEQVATRLVSLLATSLRCIRVIAIPKAGNSRLPVSRKEPWAVIRRLTSPYQVLTSMAP